MAAHLPVEAVSEEIDIEEIADQSTSLSKILPNRTSEDARYLLELAEHDAEAAVLVAAEKFLAS